MFVIFAIYTMIQLSVLLLIHGISATTGILVCPNGWYQHTNNQCYWPSDFTTSRINASSICASWNGTLVTVNTSDITIFLRQQILSHANTSFWIGLALPNIQGQFWKWSSGLHWNNNVINWCSNHAPYTTCAVVYYEDSGMCIKSYVCKGKVTDKRRFICEKVRESSTSLCPSGWMGSSHEGSNKCLYNSGSTKLDHANAARWCWAEDANLVTVFNNGDQKYLTGNRPGNKEVYWIGFYPYIWDDGAPYNWFNWDEDETNLMFPDTVIQPDGTWTFRNGLDVHNFICQKGAEEGFSTSSITAATATSTAPSTVTQDRTTPITQTMSMSATEPSTTASGTQPEIELTATAATHVNSSGDHSRQSGGHGENKVLLYILIGIYSAVGVTSIVFLGLLAKYISLRRHITTLELKEPIEIETDNHNLDDDDHKLYDNPEYVSVEHQEQSTSGVSKKPKENVDDSKISASAQVLSINSNREVEIKRVPTSRDDDIALEDISLAQNHEVINGDVYAVVDRNRSLQLSTAKLAPKEKQTFENVAQKQITDSNSNDGNEQTMPNHDSSDHEDDGHVYYNNPHSLNNNSNFEDDNIYDDAINVTIPESVNSDTEDDKL